MVLDWLQLAICALAIAYAGARLTRLADAIGEKTGMSGSWVGLLLLAAVTSLPELATGISAVTVATVVSGAGWLLLVTTGVMAFIPWRVHRAFTQRTVPRALAYLPLMGLASLAAGATVLWAMFSAGAA